MNLDTNTITVTKLKEHVLHALLYFDIFNYPLKADEVFRFLGTDRVDENLVRKDLDELTAEGLIYRFDNLYSIQNDSALIRRRIMGNLMAEDCMELARSQAKRIANFPFVRAVMASGSLSKGYMDEKSDLDFFIVTEPGKLWIARTLLVMYKRIFLFNSHKFFCVNYFVDHDHLKIEEENLFTATELATVIPLYNWNAYVKLHVQNQRWLKRFFPNFRLRGDETVVKDRTLRFKNTLEKILGIMSKPLEYIFRKLTFNRWKRIYAGKYDDADFNVAFKSKAYASKNHPQHFQKKVLDLYYGKLAEFANKNGIVWHS